MTIADDESVDPENQKHYEKFPGFNPSVNMTVEEMPIEMLDYLGKGLLAAGLGLLAIALAVSVLMFGIGSPPWSLIMTGLLGFAGLGIAGISRFYAAKARGRKTVSPE